MQKCPSSSSGMAGKAESCKGCPNANICANSKPDEDIPIIQDNLKMLKLIIAVISGKGGVGKSTISRNIAASITELGIKTVLLDLDLSGPSIPRLTGTEDVFIFSSDGRFEPIITADGIGVISIGHLEHTDDQIRVFNTNTKNYAIKKILKNCAFDKYDVMVIDTPPNITEEHLALVNYIKPHLSIVVTTSQLLSLNDVRRQISFCKKTQMEILGVIENMKNFICPKCCCCNNVYSDTGIEQFCSRENIAYLGSVPLQIEIAKRSDVGMKSDNKVFEDVAQAVQRKLTDT